MHCALHCMHVERSRILAYLPWAPRDLAGLAVRPRIWSLPRPFPAARAGRGKATSSTHSTYVLHTVATSTALPAVSASSFSRYPLIIILFLCTGRWRKSRNGAAALIRTQHVYRVPTGAVKPPIAAAVVSYVRRRRTCARIAWNSENAHDARARPSHETENR
jgi:hypothetical protein